MPPQENTQHHLLKMIKCESDGNFNTNDTIEENSKNRYINDTTWVKSLKSDDEKYARNR